ncbi:ALBINO3-like protein 2, chloroplastic isoform X2 [Punica granatum]|uniref:ALBINO3-like protein 2, chloroplastic isoform X2 n=1 Tax=Punica granatum TaxID=22663 RepID=A0A6P8E0C4_PUNGR|nr:ALBINO3-like protein 2, chloroplastic isoform X2 [Punica granatum]
MAATIHVRRCALLRSSPSVIHSGRPLSSPKPFHSSRLLASVGAPLPSAQPPFQSNRFFSASSAGEHSQLWGTGQSTTARSEHDGCTSSGLSDAAQDVLSSVADDGPILPVNVLISLLDRCHDLSGLPWWVVIASSTMAMRIALLPVLVIQLRKLKRIAELTPKLPPPLPPPFSGRSYLDHIILFQRERRASGCPSLLWMLSSFSVQVPCFLLWVATIRKMSLDNHTGFDSGGILWFQNLTENPRSVLGSMFPLLIGVLHYTNVQISFSRLLARENPYLIDLLAKAYKKYLDLITFPIICIGFCIPQGSLVYWVTNATQISLRHPTIQMKLGLPKEDILPERDPYSDQMVTSEITFLGSETTQKETSEQDLSPRELLALSLKLTSEGNRDRAISLLKMALKNDPDYITAMIILGQTLLQREEPEEAALYLEGAISKLFRVSYLTEAEYLYLLMVASQWAGVAYIQQSKYAQGIIHLERIALLKEPKEPKSKADYYEGLVLLASALFKEGRRAEAAKYLRRAAAYDSRYDQLLEQCEKETQNFVRDLVNSRRGDY